MRYVERWGRWVCLACTSCGIFLVVACVSDSPGSAIVEADASEGSTGNYGAVGDPCYPNGTCDPGLTCASSSSSKLCVAVDSGAVTQKDAGAEGGLLDASVDATPSCYEAGIDLVDASATAAMTTSPPTIDGNLNDWACAPFFILDSSDTATTGIVTNLSVSVSARWDSSTLYFAFHVIDPDVGGSSASVYLNDAVEVFIGAGGIETGTYGPNDIQLMVDHLNQGDGYRNGQEVGLPTGFASGAVVTSVGYDVEMAIPGTAVDQSMGFTARNIAFDVQLDNWDNSTPQAGVIWYRDVPDAGCNSHCGCGTCAQPACNTCEMGQLTLNP